MKNQGNEEYLVSICGIIGAIIGTFWFCVSTFGEWYAEFDVEPTGLITGILTIAVWLLPFAFSVFLGGGLGAVVGFAVGLGIAFCIRAIIALYNNIVSKIKKIKNNITRKIEIKADTKAIKKANKSIEEKIKRLDILKKQGINCKQTYSEKHLCELLSSIYEDGNILFCIDKISKHVEVVEEIEDIKKEIESLAMKYKNIGNISEYEYYINLIEN